MNVYLKSDSENLDRAFRTALGDLAGNIAPRPTLPEGREKPVILAGLAYDRPWTRDAAVNSWNGCGLLCPDPAEDTLKSVLIQDKETGLRIGGQYWDAIIWVTGSWELYKQTGSREFLETAFTASVNSAAYFERTEWDEQSGLFRGAPCYADGISAYPVRYANTAPWHDIHYWPRCNPDRAHPSGGGVPIRSLSGNALYYNAYNVLGKMARELGRAPDPGWAEKARRLKEAVNTRLWREEAGLYRYFEDPWEGSDLQEGIGHAFALLFGLADEARGERIFQALRRTPAGIPCLHPVMPRYRKGSHAGRHNGAVWPPIQALWADAALLRGRDDLFFEEFEKLTAAILRDGQCAEVYHPETGEQYGGLQEDPSGAVKEYFHCPRQTWSATGYLRLVLFGLGGLRLGKKSLALSPRLPEECSRLSLTGLRWQGAPLALSVRRGRTPALKVNGLAVPPESFISPEPAGLTLEMVVPG